MQVTLQHYVSAYVNPIKMIIFDEIIALDYWFVFRRMY